MDRREFIHRIKRFGKERGIEVRYDPRPGKGSHGRLWYGNKFVTVKDPRKEIGKGLLAAMLRQPGISPDEFRN